MDNSSALCVGAGQGSPVISSVPLRPMKKRFASWDELMSFDIANATFQEAASRSFTSAEQLLGVLDNLEVPKFSLPFKTKLSPYLVQLMDRYDPNCPIRLQYLPSDRELDTKSFEEINSLGEEENTVPGTCLVHRYPNRVLFLATTVCQSYCRYCTRKRIVSQDTGTIHKDEIDAAIDYLREHSEVEDVLISGGDPLLFSDSKLDSLLQKIRTVKHIRFLRIGTRLPVQLPTRITPELCAVLESHNVQMVNIHINHPKEITPLLVDRLKLLRKAGIMLGNQSVLLKGVNDSVEVLRELCLKCVEIGVRPYILYSCDNLPGNNQFTVPLKRMLELYHGLRGWISGPAIPHFIVDGEGGLGKMPVIPQYVVEETDPDGYTTINCTNYCGKTGQMPFLSSNPRPTHTI